MRAGYPTFKDINEKDEDGNAVVHSLQECMTAPLCFPEAWARLWQEILHPIWKYKNITLMLCLH